MNQNSLLAEIDELLGRSLEATSDSAHADSVEVIRTRLNGPLRVAIAGRAKAGKSTHLNALIGERLAPTDAGECTRLVTWYQRGMGYRVRARLHNKEVRELPVVRPNGVLDISLGTLRFEEVDRLEVDWPTTRLSTMTWIDTPGLEAHARASSDRAAEFLGLALRSAVAVN